MSSTIEFIPVDGEQAVRHLDELVDLYTEPPYEWGQEHAELFAQRFHGQRQQDGFTLVEARENGQLVGMGFGVTLLPDTPWWQNLTTPVDESCPSPRRLEPPTASGAGGLWRGNATRCLGHQSST